MTSTICKISNFISSSPDGEVVCAKLFLHLGSRAAVDQALSRLVKSGEILRIGRGLYVRPIDGKFGRRPPNPESVVASVAKLKGEIVHPIPAASANKFGLTTQVPVRLSYQTSGAGRTLSFGKLKVEMRQAPKWLFAVKKTNGPRGHQHIELAIHECRGRECVGCFVQVIEGRTD